MASPGAMKDRIRFQQRALDANGERLGAWTDAFTVWAELIWLRGTEAVMQSRLQGRQPVVIVVRESSATRPIDNSWRGVDARQATHVFDIKSVAPSKEPGFLEILAEMVVGHG